jgi:predicted nucleic acid-binding protein
VQITVCRDLKDNKFLELAVSGNGTHVISGDTDLLALHPFQGIEILTPHRFLELSSLPGQIKA